MTSDSTPALTETWASLEAPSVSVELPGRVGRLIRAMYIKAARRVAHDGATEADPAVSLVRASSQRMRMTIVSTLLDAALELDACQDGSDTWRMVPLSGTQSGRTIAVFVIREYIQGLGDNPGAQYVERLNAAIAKLKTEETTR